MTASREMRDLRARIIRIAAQAREGHIPSSLSVLDILFVLYTRILTIDPRSPERIDRDRMILSKGHAALGLYTVLHHRGFFGDDLLSSYCAYNGILGGHPDRVKVPGVEASTGSLGHGLPIAVGMALGLRIRDLDARVFCLVGDGEINEGTIWESALLGAHHRLERLTCIVDDNASSVRALGLGSIEAKFESFGWSTCTVDGHDHAALEAALGRAPADGRPACVVARTRKGHGCRLMEGDPSWHHRSPTRDEVDALLESLT